MKCFLKIIFPKKDRWFRDRFADEEPAPVAGRPFSGPAPVLMSFGLLVRQESMTADKWAAFLGAEFPSHQFH
jgi:hypothetical protein